MTVEVSAEPIARLLHSIIQHSGLNLTFRLILHPEGSPSALRAEFFGEDVSFLLALNAELLLALEHIAAKAVRLKPESHDRISFDAGGFKQRRERSIQRMAAKAVREARATNCACHLPPMNSRERRMLHLALANSHLRVVSEGTGAQRHVVVHPPYS